MNHIMGASVFLFKPFQPNFDTIINGGRRYSKLPGNVFFRQYIRLHFIHYMNSQDKMLFREELIEEYRTQFQRAFYWYDEQCHQYIPVLSVIIIAKKTRKVFENVYRYCRLSSVEVSRVSLTKSFKCDIDSAESIEENDSDCMADAHLLVETARKMQQLLLEQFNTTDRIRNYTALLRDGAGHGKYALQEQKQFGSILELFSSDSQNCEDTKADEDYCEDISDCDISDDEYEPIRCLRSIPKKTMKEKIDEIESKPHVKESNIDRFPIRPATRMRWNKPRMMLNSLLLLRPKSRVTVAVRLVQILRDRTCLDSFLYVLKSQRDVSHPHYRIIYEDDLFDMILTSKGCIVQHVGEETTSRSALSSDIFSYSSFPSHTSGLKYFSSSLARRHDLDIFIRRSGQSQFMKRHQVFMDSLKSTVLDYISSSSEHVQKTQRIGWANWVPLQRHERWYAWQIVVLLLLTNSVKDDIVKDIVAKLFARFPNPLVLCMHPAQFLDFLTSKAKDFCPLDTNFDYSNGNIGKGPNFCYQKARFILATSKKVVLMWCSKNVSSCPSVPWETLMGKYCNRTDQESLCRPIPTEWLLQCDESQDTLFPKEYRSSFFSSLPGIGLKMRHLCAEAIYGLVVGPAIDCHCIRFCIEMGTIHACMNLEQMSTSLISIYRNDQLVDLNEIPASISQLLSNSSRTTVFAESLCNLAKRHDLEIHMKALLMHYCRPH